MAANILGLMLQPEHPGAAVGQVGQGDVGIQVLADRAGGWIIAGDESQIVQDEAGFLDRLAPGGLVRRLARVDAAGDGFQRPGLRIAARLWAGAELFDQKDAVPDGIIAGTKLNGIRLNEDNFYISLRDGKGKMQTVAKADATKIDRDITKSSMPNYEKVFTSDEMTDLIAYLFSLRGAM